MIKQIIPVMIAIFQMCQNRSSNDMRIKISTTICTICLLLSFPCFAQNIGVISALPEEQESFLDKVGNKENVAKNIIKSNMGSHTVFTTLSGVGKVNAASIAQELISKYQVDVILFSGVAGGINKQINIGDILIASAAFQHDYGYLGDQFQIHATGTVPEIGLGTGNETIYFDLTRNWDQGVYDKILSTLLTSSSSLTPVEVGTERYFPALRMNGVIATGDQFIANEQKKESLRKLKADVVEMEGAAVAQVATKNNVPLLIIRSVSDKAGEKANIDFKTFFSAVAHNNSTLLQTIIETLP